MARASRWLRRPNYVRSIAVTWEQESRRDMIPCPEKRIAEGGT